MQIKSHDTETLEDQQPVLTIEYGSTYRRESFPKFMTLCFVNNGEPPPCSTDQATSPVTTSLRTMHSVMQAKLCDFLHQQLRHSRSTPPGEVPVMELEILVRTIGKIVMSPT
ncbi:hypothetical protein EUGRSUZ_I02374 [Eucalyptus grandis]|uniref:Uncharacterized protein n=2 Tax=Eucalyptus grandis TaxID=71139 RepID=A0ACC3JIZ6_EUCGR|nr:hypothetical protein EUGRSUZ_I02374 [Eucalyptus grandis]